MNSQERKQIAKSADARAKKHLQETKLDNGDIARQLTIMNAETGDNLILQRSFFSETFAKNDKRRNLRLAETIERTRGLFPYTMRIRKED